MENIRINKPKNIEGQKLYLLVHHGFDFEPTVLAVCSSEEKANEMFKEHYATPENKDMPWNGVALVVATMDDWIKYE